MSPAGFARPGIYFTLTGKRNRRGGKAKWLE
jgi:hypothetical protein